jgi:hypothetical protein
MMGLLMAKKLWQYVTKDHDAEDVNDQQAKGYIWINIEHQQRSHVPNGANAHQTWSALCNKHEKVGPQVIANCIFGITNLRYVDVTKMEDHLGKIKEYFTRLDAVDCQLPQTVKAVLILATLPPSWEVFKQTQGAVASTPDSLIVSNLCLAILQERDRKLLQGRSYQPEIEERLLIASQQTSTTQRRKQDLQCTWCLRRRHSEEDCKTVGPSEMAYHGHLATVEPTSPRPHPLQPSSSSSPHRHQTSQSVP